MEIILGDSSLNRKYLEETGDKESIILEAKLIGGPRGVSEETHIHLEDQLACYVGN